MYVHFNIPPYTGAEDDYVLSAIKSRKICGDGEMTKKCSAYLEAHTGAKKVLLTSSGSSAIDMAALLVDVHPGDEVIMPSFTFSSTANAFVLRGATIVFVDIRPDTQNLDETLIEDAITERTRAIAPMHYAGISCEMDAIMDIAGRHGLAVVEDAAQGVMSSYKGQALGAIGDYGCYSFHETKNYSMGEGGAILINRQDGVERAEILREKGTDRSKFLRGQVDKYTWVDLGSSYLPSELNAAYLLAQLDRAELINSDRLRSWNCYYEAFKPLSDEGLFAIPIVPEGCVHNAHIFYVKVSGGLPERVKLAAYLKEKNVGAVFHYVPLHSAPAGKKFGRFHGEDRYTTATYESLLRLPMHYGLTDEALDQVIEAVYGFYGRKAF